MKKIIFFLFFGALFIGGYAQTVRPAYWELIGNSGTTNLHFLGTTDCKPIIFKTNDTERMRLLSDKPFLGIGLFEPQSILHLHYQLNGDCGVGIFPTPGAPLKLLQLTTPETGSGENDGFTVSYFNTKNIRFKQHEQAKFFIEGPAGGLMISSNGNIGMGTESPQQKLHIEDGNILISKTSPNYTNTRNGTLRFTAGMDNNPSFDGWGIERVNSVEEGYGLDFWRYFLGTVPGGPFQSLFFLGDNRCVGIGTKDPQATLDVNGSFRALSANITGTTYLNGKLGIGTNNPHEQMQIGDIWTFHNGGTKYIGRNVTYTSSGNVRIEQGVASLLNFSDGSISLEIAEAGPAGSSVNITGKNLTLTDAGNVGIGKHDPKAKLDVNGSFRAENASITGILSANVLNVPNVHISKTLTAPKADIDTIVTKVLNAQSVDINATLKARYATIDDIIFTRQLSATTSVNTGTLLANIAFIGGTVFAKEVQVALEPDWPDFVFSKDYNLLSLSEVEQFIAENQHLPNVPSAAEVGVNGINLGEMNAILLQKIEELTLYIIDQEKQIKELKKLFSELESKKGGE
ncbi:MAG: hypothetical protein FWC34_08205 [Bacteroidetes bacterium]|nr:hypothetical protein [Bacteroidota bacterium]MCL2302386.1 hypothetical protein [Lentimicrobiaceae bacterium]